MKKFLNFLAVMVICLVPVVIARENYFNYPNEYPYLQWGWVILSYWVLAPFLIKYKDAHVGISENASNSGNYHNPIARLFVFLLVLIIWALIFFLG